MKVYTNSHKSIYIGALKVVVSLVLIAMLSVFIFFGFSTFKREYSVKAEASFELSGAGTKTNPYQIATTADLLKVVKNVNADELPTDNVYFLLTQDIDMSGVDTFEPIGTEAKPFGGVFLGGTSENNYHIISNLNSPKGGLFGQTASSSKIEGVGLLNANVGDNSLYSNVGGLVGINRGLITHCFFNGTVKGISNVGGLVGLNGSIYLDSAIVRYSYSSGQVIASGTFVGGLVGRNECQIFASYSLSVISAAYWSGGGVYSGNIGGVLGGRIARPDDISTTPSFVYFNRSVNNPNMNAIGFGSSSMDQEAVTDDLITHKYAGLTSQELATKSINEMFGSAHASSFLRKYATTDYSAYYAPVVQKLVPNTSDHESNVKFKHSVAIRNYGYDPLNYGLWGSEENPFLIENATHFDNLAKSVTRNVSPESYLGKFFKQTKDIDFSTIEELTIVGNGDGKYYPFAGTYDGNLKKIKNFNLEGSEYAEQNKIGLFGLLTSSSVVKNVIIDESCSFVGKSAVGSLVGFSAGATISNIHSRAKVFASTEKGGGIIGQAEGGNYTNILSDVSFENVPLSLAPKHKGVLGYQSHISTFTNVWYVNNPSRSNSISGTDEYGNIVTINPEFGSIVSSIDNTGQITFTLNANSGWSGEFRKDTEEKLSPSESHIFRPDKETTQRNLRFYGRFVKTVEITVENKAGTPITDLTYTAFPTLDKKYWSAQTFEITIKLGTPSSNGKYIDDIEFYDSSSNLITVFHEYSYFSHSSELKVKVRMSAALKTVKVITGDISITGGAFDSPKEYTGTEIYTLVPDRDLTGGGPAGFTFALDNHGTRPINATNDGRLSIVYAKDGITRGKLLKEYIITKKLLTINFTEEDHSVVTTEKEYDGLGGTNESGQPIYQSTVVDQSKVIGIVESDTDNEAKLHISAEIYYSSADVSPNPVQVTVRFSMRGLSAINYELPGEKSGPFGKINKRAVSVVIQREYLQKEYDSKNPSIVAHNYWAGNNIPEELQEKLPKNPPIFTFSPAGVSDIGDYELTATFRDPSDSNFFNLYLKIENPKDDDPVGNQGFLTYKIKPKASTVSYVGFSEGDYGGASGTLVYSPFREMDYKATFRNLNGNIVNLSFDYYEKTENLAEANLTIGENLYKLMTNAPSLAGEYAVKIIEGDNYGLSADTTKIYYLRNPLCEFKILKAPQETISITSQVDLNFGAPYTLQTAGGSGSGTVSYQVVTDNPLYENTGEIQIGANGGVTTVKAGKVYIVATKAESDNYNAAESVPFALTINKVTISLGLKSFESEYGLGAEMQFSFDNGAIETPNGFAYPPKVLIETNDGLFAYYSSSNIYDAGVYNIKIEEETANSISYGYEFDYDTTVATFTVKQKKIKVKASNVTVTYGTSAPLEYTVYSNNNVELDDILLAGTLSRKPGNNVGSYAVTVGNIKTKNPNYDIAFTSATYQIIKAKLVVKCDPMSKEYGSTDPTPTFTVEGLAASDTIISIGLSGVIERATGEDAYRSGDATPYRTYAYFVNPSENTRFKHNSNNYESNVQFVPSVLTIHPSTPTFSNFVKVYVSYGNSLHNALYGATKSEVKPEVLATAKGKVINAETSSWETADIAGTYEWRNPDFKPNFAEVTSVPCEVLFRPHNRNYKRSYFTINVLPIKLEVTVTFTGETTYEYNGSSHKGGIRCTFDGVRGNDDLNEVIVYSGDVKDVGVYTATVTINQGNYTLIGIKTINIRITPKTLTISHPDAEVALGEEINYNFIYEGFISGEDESVLSTLPIIEYPQVVGLQEGVVASHASATNYNIEYEPFNVTVLRTEIPPKEEGDISIQGVFKDNVVSQSKLVESGLDYKKIAGKVEAAKKKTEEISSTAIASMYVLKFVDEKTGNVIADSGATSITITLTEEQLAEFKNYTIVSVSYSGDIAVLNSPEVSEDNTVVFDVENIESIVFLKQVAQPIDFKRYIPIAVGGVAGIVIIAVIISAIVKKKNAKRIIKFRQN